MFEVISSLNLVDPTEMSGVAQGTELRGYDTRTFLTGQFALRLSEGTIRPLSVSDISDYLCPTRRDLYFKKGKRRPTTISSTRTWGRIAGYLVEEYFLGLFHREVGERNNLSYKTVRKAAKEWNTEFEGANRSRLRRLVALQGRPSEDPEWLLGLLHHAGKSSLGSRSLNSILARNNAPNLIRETDVGNLAINPNVPQIGISRGVRPDFILPSKKIVGDIKSGIGFKDYFLYTCTGYALAYENAMGKGNDIDIGVIFFFPTRCSDFAKPISFGQTYIFVIDDELRDQFKRRRNEAYNIISQENPPEMPPNREKCHYCQFKDNCLNGAQT